MFECAFNFLCFFPPLDVIAWGRVRSVELSMLLAEWMDIDEAAHMQTDEITEQTQATYASNNI